MKRWSSPKGLGFGDTEAREGRGGNIKSMSLRSERGGGPRGDQAIPREEQVRLILDVG